MVLRYPNNKYRGFNIFSDARKWLLELGHDTFHFWTGPSDGPKTESNEHSGRPNCYVATNGQERAIFDKYEYEFFQYLALLFLANKVTQ